VVIGGGDTAMEEALFLSRFAEEVAIVHRREELRASKIMIERAKKNSKIKFYLNSKVTKIEGKESVQKVMINDESYEASAVFFAIGHSPNSDFVKDLTFRDEYGYIMAVKVSGLFTAGDVSDKEYRQAITAAGEGCKAALKVVKFLEEQ
jgi:thioredoxin reductase (NADPH)